MRHTSIGRLGQALLVIAVLSAACAGGTSDRTAPRLDDDATPAVSPEPATPSPSVADASPSPSSSAGGTVDASPVPDDIVDRIVADAVERTGVASSELRVVEAAAVQYRDGSLGCPEPGMSYTQALVSGYWLVLDAAGTELDYRIGGSGGFRLCEGGGTTPAPNPDV